MQVWQTMTIVLCATVLVAVIGWQVHTRWRSRRLQRHFGPEYDRTVLEMGRRQAESELTHREARLRKLQIQPLSASDQQRLLASWKRCQNTFVDHPASAVKEATALIGDVMRLRGYSAVTYDDRVAEISAAYPDLAAEYREACEIVERNRSRETSTEDLRKAFVHFRALFDELLEEQQLRRAS